MTIIRISNASQRSTHKKWTQPKKKWRKTQVLNRLVRFFSSLCCSSFPIQCAWSLQQREEHLYVEIWLNFIIQTIYFNVGGSGGGDANDDGVMVQSYSLARKTTFQTKAKTFRQVCNKSNTMWIWKAAKELNSRARWMNEKSASIVLGNMCSLNNFASSLHKNTSAFFFLCLIRMFYFGCVFLLLTQCRLLKYSIFNLLYKQSTYSFNSAAFQKRGCLSCCFSHEKRRILSRPISLSFSPAPSFTIRFFFTSIRRKKNTLVLFMKKKATNRNKRKKCFSMWIF